MLAPPFSNQFARRKIGNLTKANSSAATKVAKVNLRRPLFAIAKEIG
jgi:hypothetical protein